MRLRRWYSSMGIEEPFPWVGVAVWTAVPVLGAVVGIGIPLLVMLFGGDRIVDHLVHF